MAYINKRFIFMVIYKKEEIVKEYQYEKSEGRIESRDNWLLPHHLAKLSHMIILSTVRGRGCYHYKPTKTCDVVGYNGSLFYSFTKTKE